jgi:hypothetical protein
MLHYLLPDNDNRLVMARLDGTDVGLVSCVMPDKTVETFPMPAHGLKEVVGLVLSNKARFATIG